MKVCFQIIKPFTAANKVGWKSNNIKNNYETVEWNTMEMHALRK